MDGNHFGIYYDDGAQFVVHRQGSEIWARWPVGYSLEDACTYLVGPVIAFALRLRGSICLHASSVVVDDRAIALLGVAGAGKSTTAAAFAVRGFPVLSDDIAVLAEHAEGFLVQPGYPRVNLWPDSVRALFGSADALPRIAPTWEKRYLALDENGHRFQKSATPLAAVYVLGGREPNLTEPLVEAVGAQEAFMTLVANSYVTYLLDADMRAHEFEVFARMLHTVAVRRVRPASDASKVFDLCAAIAADARRIRVAQPAAG